MFDPGLKKADLVQALGDDLAGTIPNNYRLVREAIDRGIPLDEVSAGNPITMHLKKLILPQIEGNSESAAAGLLNRLSFSFAK
jgi:pilus assembly protein CpaE